MRTRRPIAAAAVSLALLVAACGDDGGDDTTAEAPDETTTSQAAAQHNDADVAFAQMMIPHHGQAIEMAALAADRAESPQIRDLATRIQGAQDPEIQQMTGWLEEWGEEVPAVTGGHSMDDGTGGTGDTGPMDDPMGGEPMAEGMMDEAAMMGLEAATGAAFDRMFAELMIQHHQGAVDMANAEIENGQFAGAIALAEAIVEAQQAEISEMQAFLAQAS